MVVRSALKRQNFNVSPEEETELQRLRDTMGASSVKDALLRATRVVLTLAQEIQQGRRIYIGEPGGSQARLMLPDMEASVEPWKYLTPRPHAWKRQLFVKGRRLTAANVWYDMQANDMSSTEAAENWDLPLEAIEEIDRYCQSNQALIAMEADEERRTLLDACIPLASGARG